VCFLFVGGLRENIEVYICRDGRSKASSPQSKHTMYGGMGIPTSLARDGGTAGRRDGGTAGRRVGGTAGRRDGTKIKQLALTSVSVAGMKRPEASPSPLDGMLVHHRIPSIM